MDSSFSRSYRKSQSNYPRGLPRLHGAQNTEPRVMSFRFIIYRRTHIDPVTRSHSKSRPTFQNFPPTFSFTTRRGRNKRRRRRRAFQNDPPVRPHAFSSKAAFGTPFRTVFTSLRRKLAPGSCPGVERHQLRHAAPFAKIVVSRLRARASRDITVPIGTFVRAEISR